MPDIDYQGEVNNPDGIPGFYDQAPPMYRRVTRSSPCQKTRRGTWSGNAKCCSVSAVHDAVSSETL
eukprot:6190242-Pleurochrysis_carterae.AAC.1